MKIRAGYVSNSSSSSFLVYGKEIDRDDVLDAIGREEAVYCVFPDCGSSGECEDFIFKATPYRMKQLLDNGVSASDMVFVLAQQCWIEPDGMMDIENDLKSGRFFSFDKDYNSPRLNDVSDDNKDFKEFIERMNWR